MAATVLRQPTPVLLISLIMVTVLGLLDYLTGWEFQFFVFYFIPITYSAWYCKAPVSLMMALLSAGTWFLADHLLGHAYS